MSKKWKNLLAVVGSFCFAAALAVACPDEDAHKAKDANVVKSEDGRSESTAKKPCCDKPCGRPGCAHGEAAVVSDKSAGETKHEHKGGCSHAKGTTVAEGSAGKEGGCSIGKKVEAVLASLPHIQYRVGSETVDCPHAAGAMAAKNGGKMEYVVGEQVFPTKGEAFGKLASVLDDKAKEMVDVQYAVGGDCVRCPMSAKRMAEQSKSQIAYRVGGVDFTEKDKAEKTAQLVKDAVASLKTTYKVGDESFCCDKMAGMRAKETGKPVTYMVGEQSVANADELQYKLAEAKIRTIVETAAGQLGS